MHLYRLNNLHPAIEFSYVLPEAVANRLGEGLVDIPALVGLAHLVDARLENFDDLVAAERALRAFVFHDCVTSIVPSVLLTIVNEKGGSFQMSESPGTGGIDVLQPLLDHAGFSHFLGGIDQLIAFPDPEFGRRYAAAHERRRRSLPPPPTGGIEIIRSPEASELIYVAENKDEFFSNAFGEENYLKRFIRPIVDSGRAAYLAHATVSDRYAKMRNSNAREFFEPLDISWEEHLDKLRRALDIRFPPITTLVLARADNRAAIVDEVITLREEFSAARRQLWTLFDEADFRVYNLQTTHSILHQIELEAAQIVPKAFQATDYWFSFDFDIVGRIAGWSCLSTAERSINILESMLNIKSGWTLDASRLLSKNLEGIDFRQLVARHLTEKELIALEAP